MNERLSIEEFARAPQDWIDQVRRTGAVINIVDDGETVVQLVPQGYRATTLIGLHQGAITLTGDLDDRD